MRLLVTGGAGYVGSVCAAHLLETGHSVTVLDDLSTGHRDAVPDGARLADGDLAEIAGDVLAEGLDGAGYDGVLHFAARSLVGESVVRPELYWSGNVVTTLRLLEAIRAHGVPRLVFSSTAATYGEPERVPIRIETTPSDDLRSYHVSSRKIKERLGYVPKRTIEDAVRDLCVAFKAGKLPNSLTDDRYFNVKTVQRLALQ